MKQIRIESLKLEIHRETQKVNFDFNVVSSLLDELEKLEKESCSSNEIPAEHFLNICSSHIRHESFAKD